MYKCNTLERFYRVKKIGSFGYKLGDFPKFEFLDPGTQQMWKDSWVACNKVVSDGVYIKYWEVLYNTFPPDGDWNKEIVHKKFKCINLPQVYVCP